MKDWTGRELQVGDLVAFNIPGFKRNSASTVLGGIVALTPHRVRIQPATKDGVFNTDIKGSYLKEPSTIIAVTLPI